MTAEIRAAAPSDIVSMVDLLMQDAARRHARDAALWALDGDARRKVEDALTFALTEQKQPFRQKWLVAQSDDKPADHNLVGIIHTLRLPVPPIYAGRWGDPGLLMPETLVTDDAPAGTLDALVDAAEADLLASGAELLLASWVCGDESDAALRGRGYQPLTLYLSKSGFETASQPPGVRAAAERDIDGDRGPKR